MKGREMGSYLNFEGLFFAYVGMVDDVLPRSSELQDPAVANVDQVLLVFALERPPLDLQVATRCAANLALFQRDTQIVEQSLILVCTTARS